MLSPTTISISILCLVAILQLLILQGTRRDVEFLLDHVTRLTHSLNHVTTYVVNDMKTSEMEKDKD